MRCPNCSAECSDQAVECEFCNTAFPTPAEKTAVWFQPDEPSVPPPIPDYSLPPTPPSSFESDNPYAASASASYTGSLLVHDVPNYLPLSITAAVLSLCCCCIPFGIVPLIFSTQVNTKLAAGDYSGARSASDNAKLWSWISIGVALAAFVLNLFVNIAGTLAGLSST
jgi:hypothetical protein